MVRNQKHDAEDFGTLPCNQYAAEGGGRPGAYGHERRRRYPRCAGAFGRVIWHDLEAIGISLL